MPSNLSGLQVDMRKLLEGSLLHLDQAQKDTERIRQRLSALPWDIFGEQGQGLLHEAHQFLLDAERRLFQSKRIIGAQIGSKSGKK
tara:strand:+ start:164 stop:421 length:258 start_codon:yes stop_codon:yes gene_type:complete